LAERLEGMLKGTLRQAVNPMRSIMMTLVMLPTQTSRPDARIPWTALNPLHFSA
jgi:hypothetical protein